MGIPAGESHRTSRLGWEPIDERDVRAAAQAVCDALVAGDIDAAIGFLSEELR